MPVAQVRWEDGRPGNPRLAGGPGPEVSYRHYRDGRGVPGGAERVVSLARRASVRS